MIKRAGRNVYGQFRRAPAPIFRAQLDNIAIVPASLLPFKNTWQKIANNLPRGAILICHYPTNSNQQKLLENISSSLRDKGKSVMNISAERII